MNTAIAKPDANPFANYQADRQKVFPGALMKFVKGDYPVGKGGDTLPVATRLVAVMTLLTLGWQCWVNGVLVDSRLGLYIDSFVPRRATRSATPTRRPGTSASTAGRAIRGARSKRSPLSTHRITRSAPSSAGPAAASARSTSLARLTGRAARSCRLRRSTTTGTPGTIPTTRFPSNTGL